jgi:hypothetical protein
MRERAPNPNCPRLLKIDLGANLSSVGHMDCPFCDELATMQPPKGYDGDVIDCPKFGRIKIARDAVEDLKALNMQERLAALDSAKTKAKPGDTPEIKSVTR